MKKFETQKRKRRVLIISPFAYSTVSAHGGGVYCAQQLKAISDQYEIHFVTFTGEDSHDFVNEHCAKLYVHNAGQSRIKRAIGVVLSVVRFRPSLRPHTMAFARFLREALDEASPDVVLVQFPSMAGCVRLLESYPSILDIQDVFTVSKRRRVETEKGPMGRLKSYLIWQAWRRYEKTWYAKYDFLMTLSDNDTAALQKMGLADKAATSPLAIDIPAIIKRNTNARVGPTIGFLGWFGYAPNVNAAKALLEDIFPEVVRQKPTARMLIGGKDLPVKLSALCRSEGIEYLGFVESLDDFFGSIDIFVAPLDFGAGVKIKVLQAMAYGCPTITTRIGAEGIAHGRCGLLIHDNNREIADAVVRLADNPQAREDLARQSRQYAESRFSWNKKKEFLMERIEDSIEKHNAEVRGS